MIYKANILFLHFLNILPCYAQADAVPSLLCAHASKIVHAEGVNLSSDVIFCFSRNIFAAVSLKLERSVHTQS